MDETTITVNTSAALRKAHFTEHMRVTLAALEENDTNYTERYRLVLLALYLAAELGYTCGIGFDEREGTDWPVAYIELPEVGQVSWHMPAHPRLFDGHDTPEKYARCRQYVHTAEAARPAGPAG